MTPPLRLVLLGAALVAATALAQEQPASGPPDQSQQPRFRAGANLVRVDAYVTDDGALVEDLTADDFEVLEDNVPQRIESFQLVRPRLAGDATPGREPNTVAESRAMATAPDTRVFVLFMDLWHVQLSGSFRAQSPILNLLGRVIGPDDLVGVMTPEMSARNLTLARRPETIESIFRDHWNWGQRGQVNALDPREEEIRLCYPDSGSTTGLASEVIRRRRAARTLDALEGLIIHLDGIREERKFVVLLSEGWVLNGPDSRLGAPVGVDRGIPGAQPVGVDPGGRLRVDPNRGSGPTGSCDRERSMLAFADHATQFLQLLQRANRANISFYPVDPRGLVAFDAPIGPERPPGPTEDAANLRDRADSLRTIAEATDGYAVVGTNAIEKGLERMVQDTGVYYLLGYYSTNTRLDGRFRKVTVKVKRPGAEVRARPGYLAPTEAELASARVDALMNGAPPGHTTIPPTVSRALDGLAPARAFVPLRVQTAAAGGSIWLTGELDVTTSKADEWQKGGQIQASFEHDRGAAAPIQTASALAPGARAFTIATPSGLPLAPGRYVVRVQMTPATGALPLQTVAEVTVPEPDWLLSDSGLVSRRGPSTGLQYVPTADARFTRTERIRFEVPRGSGDEPASARLLGRDGQPLTVALTVGERVEPASQQRLVVVDVTLAPLAQGEYVLEVTAQQGDRSNSAAFAFRLVP